MRLHGAFTLLGELTLKYSNVLMQEKEKNLGRQLTQQFFGRARKR